MNSFRDGDVVRLNSGGPAMTLMNTRSGSMKECVWFRRTWIPWRYELVTEIFTPGAIHPVAMESKEQT